MSYQNESQVFAALQKRYPSAAWALFPQVRNGTGFTRRVDRTADAIAMGLWPSRGLEVIGFEIKVRRSDWLLELRSPAKADAIASYCDTWYLVVGDAGIVELDEVPQAWGLLVPQGQAGLKVAKKPDADGAAAKPLDRLFIASLLKAAAKGQHAVDEQRRLSEIAGTAGQASYERGVENGKEQAQYEIGRMKLELDTLKRCRKEFEEASGVDVGQYGGRRMGQAVKTVLAGGVDGYMKQLRQIRAQAQQIEASVTSVVEESEFEVNSP